MREALTARSLRQIAENAGLPRRSVQSVLDGHVPSLNRAEEICNALGLEFYIGPPVPRSDDAKQTEPDSEFLGENSDSGRGEAQFLELAREKLNEAVAKAFEELKRTAEAESTSTKRLAAITALPPNPEAHRGDDSRKVVYLRSVRDLAGVKTFAVTVAEGPVGPPGTRRVSRLDVEVAAGGGAFNEYEQEIAGLWIEKLWLDQHCVDANQCSMIKVRGESMEPTLRDGDNILVDLVRRQLLDGHVFVLRTDNEVLVKRLRESENGWVLMSDHPAWPDVPCPDDAEVIGEVRRSSARCGGQRELILERRIFVRTNPI